MTTRWPATLATAAMLAMSALPFVVLFPQPPAFGRPAALVLAAATILAVTGTVHRGGWRVPIARRAAGWRDLGGDWGDVASVHRNTGQAVRYPDPRPAARLLDSQGEDIDDACLHEKWLEIWLAVAATALLT